MAREAVERVFSPPRTAASASLGTMAGRIWTDLAFIGITLDPEKNAAAAAIISSNERRVVVRVMRTDEERTVARNTARLVAAEGSSHVAL